jgi:hypothetical protein
MSTSLRYFDTAFERDRVAIDGKTDKPVADVTRSATSASISVAGTRTIDSALDLRHMRRAISKKNQLPSAMPKGQRTKGLASKGID